MSQGRERFEDFDLGTAIGDFEEWYQIPTLVVLLGFMLWIRVQSYSNFIKDGQVVLSGNDAWYHLRMTSYTVRNWPATMPFDPWTYFPYGTAQGQFGSLFDQIVATVALIVGLGSPDQQTIATVLLVMPAVFGTLVAIPVYLAGKRMGGTFSGLVSVLILALATGGLFQRSLVGFSDHHVAEALFQMIAVLGFMVAVSVSETEMPVWELVADREWDSLRRPLAWSVLAGIGLALYIWVWPPAVLLVAILGLYFLFQLSFDYLRGRSPDHVAFAGVVGLTTAGLLSFVPLSELTITATDFSLLQPLMAFAVAFGCGFMAWLARQWDARDLDKRLYPLSVVGIIGAVAVFMMVATPNLFDFFVRNAARIFGAGSATGLTIGEAQPLSRPIITFFASYGLTAFSALFGAVLVVVAQVRAEKPRGETLLVLVWGLVLLFATLSQQRFTYYLVLPIVVLNAYVVRFVVQYLTTADRIESIKDIETFQVITILAVLLVVVAPLVVSVGGRPTVMAQAQGNQPSAGVVGWGSSLGWMDDNTPTPGNYGGAGNNMSYYGTYPRQADYDYPEGAYGVMSWWDYGHWITQRGERIPNANPFQQGATDAANFLLAPNESGANEVLETVSEDDAKTRYVMVDWKMANTWSRAANGKFFAPIQFYDDGDVRPRDFRSRVLVSPTRPQTAYYVRHQRYYESQMIKLWHFYGSAQQPNPVVINYDERRVGTQGGGTSSIFLLPRERPNFRQFQSMGQAEEYLQNNTGQIGGVGPNPPEFVEALEHYRLVRNSETSAVQRSSPYAIAIQRELRGLALGSDFRNASQAEQLQLQSQIQNILFDVDSRNRSELVRPPWVKVFERVPGATVEGQGPPNASVAAAVEVYSPTTDSAFIYRQTAETDAQGNFEMTLPYSTTGYENYGPQNGYTNVSARATGPYQFYETQSRQNYLSPVFRQNESNGDRFVYQTNASVAEGKVVGADTSPVQVTLDQRVIAEGDGPTTPGDGTNSTDSSGSGSTTDGDTSGSDGQTTTSDNTSTQGSIAPPQRVVSP
jgi:dolichyl-diphosphooligosaccharide--protein glycosyltransferase